MHIFTVSLFGHREIDDLRQLESRLYPAVKALIQAKQYVTFLIGRNGEFDEFAASVIKQAQKESGKEDGDVALVLPYTVAGLEYYERYYDDIIIPDSVNRVHPKAAITVKNRWMIEQSDLIFFYLERNKGGAYAAKRYAERLKKTVVNLYEGEPLLAF